MPKPEVINICHQYRARPACNTVQSDQALYCWLDIPKMIMSNSKNGRWIIPFKKFSRLRIKERRKY